MFRLREFRLFHILFFFTFAVMGLFINLLQLVMFLMFPSRLFHKINYYTVAGIYGTLICLADWWGNSTLTFYCSDQFYEKLLKKNFRERRLVVVNHHTELDWLFSWQFADRAEVLGSCRALAKKSLQYVPVIGWSSFMSGDVFLSRSWEKDKLNVKAKVEALELQPLPTWLFLFPEGTRFNQKKHKASLEFAASRGLPQLKHHLIPRTKGFALTSEHMKGGVIDLTFVQGEGAPPTLTSLLMGRTVDTRVFVREIPQSDIPKGEKETGEWLMQLFKEKDDIKDAYLASDWKRLEELGNFTPRNPPKRSWALVWTAVSNFLVLTPVLVLVMQGGALTWVVTLVILALAWAGLDQMVSVSKIQKEQ